MYIVFILINLTLLPIFISILKQSPLWVSFAFFFLVIFEGIFLTFYTLINFGGAFGPGTLLFCLSAVFFPVVFLAWIIAGVRILPQFNNQQKTMYVIGGIIILFAQASPVVGDFGIGGYCDDKKMEYGNTLVVKVQDYHKDKGDYPSKIADLIPAYVSSKPTYNCMSFLGINYDAFLAHYEIMECDENRSLVTHSSNGVRDVWYDFETGEWSSVSFFDSDCY